MAIRCPQCSSTISAGADERLPPWCRKCGASLNFAPEATPAHEDDSLTASVSASRPALHDRPYPPLSWREPTTRDCDTSPETSTEEGSLSETIQRIGRSQQVEQQKQWQARRAGLGAFFGGLALLAVGAFVIWFNAWWEGKLVVPVRLLMILILPLGISLTGLYTFLTGHQIVDFNGDLAWDITIGPEGISRTPVGGLIDGQVIYWQSIAYLEYEEDFTFGTGRILVVHLANDSRQRIRIAREVTVRQLAETVSAYGKELRLAAAGDWCKVEEPGAVAR